MDKHAKSWAPDIDKIHRIDGRPWEDIRSVIEWSQQHHFWSSNIKSGAKLRKQFDTLEGQMLADRKPKTARGGARGDGGLSAEDIWNMAREAEMNEQQ